MSSFMQHVRLRGTGGPRSPARRADPARTALTIAALALAATLRSSAAGADVSVGFSPAAMTVSPGDTFTVTIAVPFAGAAFNAFDASVRFDPAVLTFVPTTPVADQRGALMTGACANTFHLFNAAPDSLKITLSLLCSNTSVTGPGTIYQVKFQAGLTPGTTTISLGPFTEFYNAGLFARPLFKQDLTVTIGTGPTGVGDPDAGGDVDKMKFAPPSPNPRRGSGAILLDFALPAADRVAFDVLDLQGRRVAGRDAGTLPAGRHHLAWTPPALPSGDYFVRLRTLANGSLTQRWAVLR
jgi:hypothetical protein